VTQTTPGGFRPPRHPHHHLCTHLDRLTSPEIRTAIELAIDTGQPAEPPSPEPRPRYHDQHRITTTTTSRILRDDEQLEVRVDPAEVGAAPQHSWARLTGAMTRS